MAAKNEDYSFSIPTPVQNYMVTNKLDAIAEKVFDKNERFLVLGGIHGSGKTQLTYKFAHETNTKNHFGHMWKLNAVSENRFMEDFAACIGNFNISQGRKDDKVSFDKLVEDLQAIVSASQKPCLMLLDDLTPETLFAIKPLNRLKKISRLTLIITTNDLTKFSTKCTLEIYGFTEEEAHCFLRARLPSEICNDADLKNLAKVLGYSPLGLTVAAQYLREQKESIQKYIEKLLEVNSRTESLLPAVCEGYDRKLTFLGALNLAIDGMKKISKDVYDEVFQVFEMFAFLDPGCIPSYLVKEAFNQICQQRDYDASTFNADKQESRQREINTKTDTMDLRLKNNAIVILKDTKASKEETGYMIHRAMQYAIRLHLLEEQRENECLKRIVNLLYPFVKRHIAYQADFEENCRLTDVAARYLLEIAKQLPVAEREEDLEFTIKLVHIFDALAQTYIYKGKIDPTEEAYDENYQTKVGYASVFAEAALTLINRCANITVIIPAPESFSAIVQSLKQITKRNLLTPDTVERLQFDKFHYLRSGEGDITSIWKA